MPVLAVLLDGPAWAARRTVGDRDGLPVEVLARMLRWPAVERVWLPSWLADSAAGASTGWSPPPRRRRLCRCGFRCPAARRAGAGAGWRTSRRLRLLDGEQPFVPWTPSVAGERGLLDQLANRRVAEKVGRVLQAGVEAEGPIHVDRLARLTAGAFGLTRVVRARLDALAALVPASARVGDVVWPAQLDRSAWTGFRRDPAATRPMEQVPLGGDRQRDGGAVPGERRDDQGRAVRPDARGVRLPPPHRRAGRRPGVGARRGDVRRPADRDAVRPAHRLTSQVGPALWGRDRRRDYFFFAFALAFFALAFALTSAAFVLSFAAALSAFLSAFFAGFTTVFAIGTSSSPRESGSRA